MSSSYNSVTIVGNLTRDVEMRYTQGGLAIAEVGLAVNDRVKKGDQWEEETSFFDVTIFGRTAEIANEYLSRGSSVLIDGRLKQDRWEQEGQKRSKVKIICDKMVLVGSPGGGSQGGGQQNRGQQRQQPSQQSSAGGQYRDEELPF
jgi:single-strand DNA-binding protein